MLPTDAMEPRLPEEPIEPVSFSSATAPP
jgi:hypothetical protein